ncbi:MAG: NAD-dependent epimerase/dehydratase family protein, partial [Lachnospiraceae bacterium]|nr:NAD-dependent epimerase/dehydratase family protein [Lachnospiraceae bacterium]
MFSSEYKKKSVLITGGCGMIGSNLVKRLVREGWDVSVADDLWRGKVEYLYDDEGKAVIDLEKDFHKVDLCDIKACEGVVGKTDYIVHLAARVAGIEYVFKNERDIFRSNNLINSNVFHAAGKAGRDRIKGIIYVGTACSFPRNRQNTLDPEPLREEELFPAYPESSYGWSKLMGQLELDYLEKETGIP